MALIEIELLSSKFNQLVQFLASAGPIPIGVLTALGPNRLIAEFTWNSVSVGAAPPGFNVPAGTLTASCAVSIRHVSTAELDADPNATGLTTQATAFVRISATTSLLSVDLLAIDIANNPLQSFAATRPIARFPIPVPPIPGVTLAGAALLLSGGVVTLRFATRATDSLEGMPLNLLFTTGGDEWAIRLSGELFVEQLLARLQQFVGDPQSDLTIEDPATASWGMRDGNWAAIGSIGIEKEDACPPFGDPEILGDILDPVDLSITINVVLTPSANMTPVPPRLNLNLHVSSDVSDWDTFRCWLAGGGSASALVGEVVTVALGPAMGGLSLLAGAISSLIAVAETVRLRAGNDVTERNIQDFTQVSSSSTTATYAGGMNLPTLVRQVGNQTNGSTSPPTTGPFGMLISGSIQFWMAQHKVTFKPNGGTLTSQLQNSYNCDRERWEHEAKIQEITIEDLPFVPLAGDLNRILVTIFPSSVATPSQLWSIEETFPELEQLVRVFGTSTVNTGDTGRVYLHTSAGIRRFDIQPLPNAAPPTQPQIIAAVAKCARASRMFTRLDELHWLFDPPPYDFGFPPLRQWLFTFAELPPGTRIDIHRVAGGVRGNRLATVVGERGGNASFELITNADEELVLEHNQEVISEGRLLQRWIIPTEIIDTGVRGRTLRRSESLISIMDGHGTFTHDLETGRPLNRPLMHEEASRFEAERYSDKQQSEIPSFSLTLRGGKVAALFEDKLVLGIPWESFRVVLKKR
jgi:hypothetical protein